MLLYQNGDIYFGQHINFLKNGVGKLISFTGSFMEGSWEHDKLHGKNCRVFDA